MASPLRVASLLPSATEIVCAIGAGDSLVGISHECDYPVTVQGLPVLTRARIDARARSHEIDAAVRTLVDGGLSVYEIDAHALRLASPNLILTQDQCDVCAVSLADVEATVAALTGIAPQIVSLKPTRFADILASVETVGAALGCADAAHAWVVAAQARVDAIVTRAARARYRPRVACIEWIEPLMAAGNWIPEMVEMAGGRYADVAVGAASERWDWERLVASSPEVVVIMPCGFGLSQTRAEIASLTSHPRWGELPAVQNGRVYAVDGNAYLNRPGPRIVDSLELLGGLIQPAYFAARIPPDSYFRVEESSPTS